MLWISAALMIMAGMLLIVSLYYLVVYIRGLNERQNLIFFSICFTMFLYLVFSFALYQSSTLEEAIPWQLGQFILFCFINIFLIFSVYNLIKRKWEVVPLVLALGFLSYVALMLVLDRDWIFNTTKPLQGRLFFFHNPTDALVEAQPGWLVNLLYGIGVLTLIYLFTIAFIHRSKRKTSPISSYSWAILLMVVALLNDILVKNGVYPFLYLYEYSFVILIGTMLYSLMNNHLDYMNMRRHLWEEKQRFKALSEATFEAIIIHKNGWIIEANKAACDLFGYHLSEIVSMHVIKLAAAEYSSEVFEHMNHNIEIPYEAVGIRKDGSKFFGEIQGKNLVYNGEEVRVVAIRNITARKIVIEALQESEEKFRNLSEEMADGVAIILNGKSYWFNQAFLDIFGYHRLEVLDKPLDFLIYSKDLTHFYNQIQRPLNQDETSSYFQSLGVTKDRRLISLEITAKKVLFEKQDAIQLVIKDISKRTQAEKKLKESEAKYRMLVETMTEGLLIIDTHHRITYVNDRFCCMLGLKKEDILYNSIFDFMDSDNQRILSQQLVERRKGLDQSYEIAWKTLDNTKVYSIVSPKPIYNEQQEYTGSFGVVTDITRIKKAEQEIIKAWKEAENADRIKSAFLANMSHELRTPLTSILGYIDIMMRFSDISSKNKRYLEIAHNNAILLLQLIDEILELSRIEANQTNIDLQKASLNEIFSNVYNNANLLISTKNKSINLIKTIDPVLHDFIKADTPKLTQILNQLVSNAIKFTEQGDIEFGVQLKNPKQLEFYIKDTGIGIPHNMHQEIFKPFFQVDLSDTRKYGGTGLGLTLTKKLLDLMGGEMKLISEEDEGTSIYFTLPYLPLQPEGKSHSHSDLMLEEENNHY